ncbi:uncharacterized protein LOC117787300 [Drosophila innubila]|uniref:uncharacterized protein LOC117787300 n=1 Tax=Drosophila innubila TaxID=198719 RepID=UPI00148B3510|nr:uncharacterized protein LOC117787300 [Drosophila innubila]
MKFAIAMSALGLLLLVGAQGTTIISIKYPQQGREELEQTQPAKRDLSLSYAATNIDSKEGTRVKTITVIKNVGGVGLGDLGSGSSSAASNKQVKLAINPELHKNEEWANAFRDNFKSYGGLPDVPDIDDLFDFVNRKKPEEAKAKENPTESTSKAPAPTKATKATKATSEHAEDADDSDEAIVEKIKGDAELLPHIKQANILRLQAQELKQQQQQRQELEQSKRLHTRESLVNVNYSTPMHSVSQFFENYVQVLPNGYDYTKPEPCAVPVPPGNSIQVTTPSGRTYDIPQSNSSGTNGGVNHPYLAPSLAKRTQIQPQAPPAQSPPNFSSVNSIVPPIVQQQSPGNLPPNNAAQPPPQFAQVPVAAVAAAGGVSTSQRPYVAPSLRNNGLGINRGSPTPQTPLPPSLPTYSTGNVNNVNGNNNALPSYRTNGFGGRPNTYRSRGLKY